jgi:hypothetical protein
MNRTPPRVTAGLQAAVTVATAGWVAAWSAAALASTTAPQLPQAGSAPPPVAQPVAAPPATHLRFRITTALLKVALARDAGLGNALAQFVRQGLDLSPPEAGRKGGLVFVPQTAEALAAFIDDPSTPFPSAPDSAPPPAPTSGAVYWLEPTPEGGSRLVVGLDDAAQATARTPVRPNRWFEVTVASDGYELTALAWRLLPAP